MPAVVAQACTHHNMHTEKCTVYVRFVGLKRSSLMGRSMGVCVCSSCCERAVLLLICCQIAYFVAFFFYFFVAYYACVWYRR